MWLLLLRWSLYAAIGAVLLLYPRTRRNCDVSLLVFSINSIFTEAKNLAIKYGESALEFLGGGEIRLVAGGRGKVYRLPFEISAPATPKRPCSNSAGSPSMKTRYVFSPRGLKDISGSVSLLCEDRFVGFSVLSPTGGVFFCLYNGKIWEEFK